MAEVANQCWVPV